MAPLGNSPAPRITSRRRDRRLVGRTVVGGSSAIIGRTVVDDRGAMVGKVAAMVRDDADREPEWLVVETGWLGSRRYVPMAGAVPAGPDELVIPFDRAWVRAAPKAASDDRALTYELRRCLATHYGDSYDWWPRRRGVATLTPA